MKRSMVWKIQHCYEANLSLIDLYGACNSHQNTSQFFFMKNDNLNKGPRIQKQIHIHTPTRYIRIHWRQEERS